MCLPISTPPNALAGATGLVETRDMAKIGLVTGVLGLALTFAMLLLLARVNFF
jgi:sodium-dependent dicarboxylate transporter 2/3/5